MVQDLWIINEAVVPLHPTVTNPYVILGEILPSAKWFSFLDLRDAFVCISLTKESQYLFAFERGYKVSHAKAQMVETKVTHLGVQITHGSRRLFSDRVQGLLQFPIPMT